MLHILLFALLSIVHAEWPPYNCKKNSKIQDNVLIMTSATQNKIKSRCDILEDFSGAVYVKFARIYHQNSNSKSDSVLSFDFTFEHETKFSLELHNDRLKVVPAEHTDIRLNNDACMAILARQNLDWFNWMRVRVNHLAEIERTFVSVDLVSYEGNNFTPCVRFETPYMKSDYNIRVVGYTDSKMRQEVHEITSIKPDLNTYTSAELAARLSQMEKRVQRIHTTLQRYMGYHDDHIQKTSEKHETLKGEILSAKNGIKSRSDSHMITQVFIVFIAFVCICAWITYKIKQEKRFHLL